MNDPRPRPGAAATEPDEERLRRIYTVSRLNLEVRALIESAFPPIWIEGEISNLARPRSGHIYFSLKDANCQVRCAMFRMHNRHLDFTPADGMHVLAQARVSLYPERGEFQLVVQYLEEAGAGALRRAFEALKQRLAAEGLFDEARKRPLPAAPRRIGVVTSPTGAAIRDVLSVLGRRFPGADVLVYAVPVQGAGAADAIAAALDRASARAECDVLILARGGGSIEDLWAFNEEVVARAIRRSRIPVVTGVGHEVDFTIADLAADRRAPTPSAAAELVVPDAAEWRAALTELGLRLERRARAAVAARRERVAWLARRLVHPRRRLFDLAQRTDDLHGRLGRAARAGVAARRATLAGLAGRLGRRDPTLVLRARRAELAELDGRLRRAAARSVERRRAGLEALRRALRAVGPDQTLERGYAIVTRARDGAVLRDPDEVGEGEGIEARLARGRIGATVTGRLPPPAE